MNKVASIILGGVIVVLTAVGFCSAADLYVPSGYSTIQAAVDAAYPGDVIYIAAGTYEEQVEIAKQLTLDGGGGGGGAIIKSPSTLTKSFTTPSTNKPVVYIHDCDGVIIKNLTIDGAGRGNLNVRFIGIAFWNAGGTVDGCVVKDIRDTPFSGAQHGVAIYSYSTGTAAHTVNVWDCDVYGFQKNAMALNAGDTNPFTVDVHGNTITGAGATTVTAQNGIQVWADLGSGTVEDNVISGIGYAGSGWVATSILDYYADLTIAGNTITGAHMGIYAIDGACDITGNDLSIEKIGDYGYGICASDPPNAKPSPYGEESALGASRRAIAGTLDLLEITVEGNTVGFSGAVNAGTVGIEVDAGYDSAYELDVAVNGNSVTGFDYGIGFYQCTSSCDIGTFAAIEARYNGIVGNTTAGMETNADYLTVDATGNWWGDATGPYHASLNPGGLGDAVSDYIDFDPYMVSANEVGVMPPATLTNCVTPKTVIFEIGAGIATPIRGYEVKFQIDPTKVTIAAPSTDVAQGSFLSSVGPTQFFVVSNGGGAYTVTCAIYGVTGGATGGGDLFSVKLTPVAEGTSAIDITSLKVRDVNNIPITTFVAADGSIRMDCTAPTMESIAEAEGGWYNAAPVLSNFGFDDDLNLDFGEYNYDGGDWEEVFSGIDAASWDDDGWTLPGWIDLAQGTHTIYFRVYDDAGNMGTASWQFYKDTIAPAPPTNFVAMPGNDKTHLSWTNPTGDDTFAGVEIRFNAWLDYPEYEATEPVYPPNAGAGTYVALVAGATYDDPRTPRDIYYYAAFSKDLAGNYSALGTTAYDRCTSYWLGDVTADGRVETMDLVAFSSAFGSVEGPPASGGWDNDCDFGPTDDWSRLGIPYPDDVIDFEDLMIFSMNYGVVAPGGLYEFAPSAPAPEDLAKVVGLDLVANDDGTFSVVLANRASTLKGMRIVVEVTSGTLDRVQRGAIFSGTGDLFFGLVPATANTADISAAALGTGKPFAGSGEVARLAIRPDGEQPVRARIVSIDLRDLDNARSEIVTDNEYEAPFAPKATALLQNFPNPFNPTTNVTFDLTAAGRVRIDVYDVSGRLIATLFDGTKGAGRHHVQWTGVDASGSLVPSGIYFYRMKTAGYEATRKMILVR